MEELEAGIPEWDQGQIERALEHGESFALFLYTPLCGTCQLAKRMVAVAAKICSPVSPYTANLNLMPALAQALRIESVPCLMIVRQGEIVSKEYAMRSVDHLCRQLGLLMDK
ncbi:thioredoxin family protein [Brevibacillus humidisoli]|uniref:thioredoxin family protein n=1 Tax=Brevibacillus humidisoli TaxID=2895522 RepID=UPI001E2C4943|nr:thioredoxin family protein [Brevibacillus humidisoli]UFJ42370.1 thioredoxin family protein [Brevibacillus humidisoli]